MGGADRVRLGHIRGVLDPTDRPDISEWWLWWALQQARGVVRGGSSGRMVAGGSRRSRLGFRPAEGARGWDLPLVTDRGEEGGEEETFTAELGVGRDCGRCCGLHSAGELFGVIDPDPYSRVRGGLWWGLLVTLIVVYGGVGPGSVGGCVVAAVVMGSRPGCPAFLPRALVRAFLLVAGARRLGQGSPGLWPGRVGPLRQVRAPAPELRAGRWWRRSTRLLISVRGIGSYGGGPRRRWRRHCPLGSACPPEGR